MTFALSKKQPVFACTSQYIIHRRAVTDVVLFEYTCRRYGQAHEIFLSMKITKRMHNRKSIEQRKWQPKLGTSPNFIFIYWIYLMFWQFSKFTSVYVNGLFQLLTCNLLQLLASVGPTLDIPLNRLVYVPI